MARRPFAKKVLRVRDGKLVAATPEFCGGKDPRFERSDLTLENLKTLADAFTEDYPEFAAKLREMLKNK